MQSRLNRETLTKSKGYDPRDQLYAREELVAEIGSMMLSAETGIPHEPSRTRGLCRFLARCVEEGQERDFQRSKRGVKGL